MISVYKLIAGSRIYHIQSIHILNLPIQICQLKQFMIIPSWYSNSIQCPIIPLSIHNHGQVAEVVGIMATVLAFGALSLDVFSGRSSEAFRHPENTIGKGFHGIYSWFYDSYEQNSLVHWFWVLWSYTLVAQVYWEWWAIVVETDKTN